MHVGGSDMAAPLEAAPRDDGGLRAAPAEPEWFCGCVRWRWLPDGCIKQAIQKDPLLAGTLIGVACGLVVGLALAPANIAKWVNELVSIPGECFLRLLKMLVLPLVFGSIMGGVMSLRRMGSGDAVRQTARRALGLYLLTYLFAMANALLMVTLIQPGHGAAAPSPGATNVSDANATSPPPRWQCETSTADEVNELAGRPRPTLMTSLTNVIYGALPTNVVRAAAETNILGVITFAVLLAAYLPVGVGSAPPTQAEAAVQGMNEVIFKIATAVLGATPYAICSLIIGRVTAACDIGAQFASLGWFIATVLTSILLHGFVTLPLIYAAFTRRSPVMFYKTFAKAFLTALAISSSAASLPVTLACADDFGVPPELSKFMLVLGATANMDGTAMYEAIAALYIMQRHSAGAGVADLILVAVTASLSAMGAAAIPSAGLVTLITVLQAVGMEEHVSDIAYIMVVDWFLDRVRTSVNVMGDAFALCIVHKASKRPGEDGGIELQDVHTAA
eukprot:TRINITY_DN16387_c0_g1_i1.p1 TRINITY_DN16387_c0_g1~~TRINITY_DN16387_c0_g1_i1.p1  ORF type:complete len:505 (+),score=138.86 TRINITY_DN16387_c0_g1_i1:33-1547(+)